MKRDTLETIIYLFCIVVLILLTFKISYDSQELDCGRCEISFKNKILTTDTYYEAFKLKVEDMFYYFDSQNKCIVSWDPVQGYIKQ